METTNLYIYGASGHGKVVLDVALRHGYKVIGFIDDDRTKKRLLGLQVITFEGLNDQDAEIALGIGNNKIREKVFQKIKQKEFKVPILIDPSVVVSNFATVGEGSVVFPNVVINNSAFIGKGCIINTGAIIEHDCVIGDFVHISPNVALAGGVKVGKYSQIGIGACVKQNITIGNNVIVGAGAVIVNDIPDDVIVVGNPGRIIKYNE